MANISNDFSLGKKKKNSILRKCEMLQQQSAFAFMALISTLWKWKSKVCHRAQENLLYILVVLMKPLFCFVFTQKS